jgi:hypothetical protein
MNSRIFETIEAPSRGNTTEPERAMVTCVSADYCGPQERTLGVVLRIALYLILLSRVVAIPFSTLLNLGVDVGIDRRSRDGIFVGFEA